MERPDQRLHRRQGGSVMVFVAIAMFSLLALTAYAIDGSFIYSTRAQLQHAADAGALAGIAALRTNSSTNEAITEARVVAESHAPAGDSLTLGAGDVETGSFDYGSRTFTPGSTGSGVPAVRVAARRSNGSPSGPIDLFFAGVVGMPQASVEAAAVAALRRKDIVLVQDKTVSFKDTFTIALDADKRFLHAMADQGLAGDRLGVISFARAVKEEMELTELSPGGVAALEGAIGGIEICRTAFPEGGPCYGTDIAAGIDQAREVLEENSDPVEAERVIVIVSDGLPCFPELEEPAMSDVPKELAVAASEQVAAAGITTFVITLDNGETGACFGSDIEFNESLATGFGFGFTTTNGDDLDDILVSVLSQMPIRLVD